MDIPTKKTSQMMMLSRKQQGTKNEKLLDVYVTKIAGWIAPVSYTHLRCYRNACDLSSQAALSNRAAPCYPVPAISRLWLLYSDPGPTIFKIGDNAYETE